MKNNAKKIDINQINKYNTYKKNENKRRQASVEPRSKNRILKTEIKIKNTKNIDKERNNSFDHINKTPINAQLKSSNKKKFDSNKKSENEKSQK